MYGNMWKPNFGNVLWRKKQNEEKKDNPSIVAQCICGLDENPELVVEIGRYTLKVTETSVSLVELQKMGGSAFHYFWYIVPHCFKCRVWSEKNTLPSNFS